MIYLLAIFCSPLALVLTGKPISALFNLVLYVLSIAFWLTIIFHHIASSCGWSRSCMRYWRLTTRGLSGAIAA